MSTSMTALATSLHSRIAEGPILILGLGREGESTYQLLRSLWPERELWVGDQNNAVVTAFQERHPDAHLQVHSPYLQDLEQFTTIFKTPGISLRDPAWASFIESGKLLTSQLNEFLYVYRDQVIGVTGTKGKSTTSALIAHLLAVSGKSTLLAGNIGKPVFDIVADITPATLVVIEMSSYQLETCRVSPHWAVWLNLFPEHLNYHGAMAAYAAAKAHIFEFQTASDFLWYNQDSPEVVAAVQHVKSMAVGFPSELDDTQAAPLPTLYQALPSLPWWTAMVLPATVKRFNILPALYVAAHFQLPLDVVQKGLASFQTLPHRLENVGTFRSVTFIDDTLATIPQATIAALTSVPNVSVLILGGYDRGIDFSPIVDAVVKRGIPTLLFFPPSGEKMQRLLTEKYPEAHPRMITVETMQEAVTLAYQHALPNSTVLLSPASPSFGQFKDYVDKSQQFSHWVHTLANSPADTAELDTT